METELDIIIRDIREMFKLRSNTERPIEETPLHTGLYHWAVGYGLWQKSVGLSPGDEPWIWTPTNNTLSNIVYKTNFQAAKAYIAARQGHLQQLQDKSKLRSLLPDRLE